MLSLTKNHLKQAWLSIDGNNGYSRYDIIDNIAQPPIDDNIDEYLFLLIKNFI